MYKCITVLVFIYVYIYIYKCNFIIDTIRDKITRQSFTLLELKTAIQYSITSFLASPKMSSLNTYANFYDLYLVIYT